MASKKGIVATAIILAAITGASFLLWIIPMQIIAEQMGLNLTLYQLGMMAAMVELIRLAPVTVQGIGLREGAFAYFITLFGQQSEAGFVLGTIIYIILSISIILSGIIGWGLSHMGAETADS